MRTQRKNYQTQEQLIRVHDIILAGSSDSSYSALLITDYLFRHQELHLRLKMVISGIEQ